MAQVFLEVLIQLILDVLIVGVLAGLVGIIWMIARTSVTDRPGESHPAEPYDGRNHTNRSFGQLKAKLGLLAAHK